MPLCHIISPEYDYMILCGLFLVIFAERSCCPARAENNSTTRTDCHNSWNWCGLQGQGASAVTKVSIVTYLKMHTHTDIYIYAINSLTLRT